MKSVRSAGLEKNKSSIPCGNHPGAGSLASGTAISAWILAEETALCGKNFG
jgi:hypothetical protein